MAKGARAPEKEWKSVKRRKKEKEPQKNKEEEDTEVKQ